MMSSTPNPFDAASFAALWSRVAPEGIPSPVVPDAKRTPQEKPEGDPSFLRSCIWLELCRRNRFRALTRCGIPCRELAAEAYGRARKLSTALFLLTGGHYFPARSLTVPACGRTSACLRSLYHDSRRMELRYLQAARRTEDSRLRALYQELGDSHRQEQGSICVLLEMR